MKYREGPMGLYVDNPYREPFTQDVAQGEGLYVLVDDAALRKCGVPASIRMRDYYELDRSVKDVGGIGITLLVYKWRKREVIP